MSPLAWLLWAAATAGELPRGDGLLSGAQVSGDEQLVLRYWRDPTTLPGFPDQDHLFDYLEQVERLSLLLAGDGWQAGAQLDAVALGLNRYYLDDVLHHERVLAGEGLFSPAEDAYASLEKLWVSASGRTGSLQAGDGYISFGRGLALNVVRNTDIDVDSSIRGVQGRVEMGDWSLSAVSGLVNAQQVTMEFPNENLRAERRHAISGLRLERFGEGPASLGAHASFFRFAREPDQGSSLVRYEEPLDAAIYGGDLGLQGAGPVDAYLEGDWYDYRSADLFGGAAPRPGHALYGALTTYLGPVVLQLEGKDYRDTERINTFTTTGGYEVSTGPTLEYERAITEDSSAAVNSNDISGARLVADWNRGPATWRLSVAAFRDRELGGLHFNRAPETILHPVAGLDWLGERLQVLLNAGFREDLRDGGFGADRLAHADLSVDFPAGPFQGELTADLLAFWWGDNLQQQSDYRESVLSLGIEVPHDLTFIVYDDFSDNPLLASSGNLSEHLYGALELQWQPRPATTIKAFYGAYKAGIRCAGGQCRVLPGFQGARLSVSSAF